MKLLNCYRYDLQINHWSFPLEMKLLKCYRYDLQINHCGTDHFHWSETVCWTACRGSRRDSSGHGCNDCVKGSWRPAPSPSMWPSSWMATAALQSSKALIVLKVISRALTNWQRYMWSCIAVWFEGNFFAWRFQILYGFLFILCPPSPYFFYNQDGVKLCIKSPFYSFLGGGGHFYTFYRFAWN